MYDTVYNKREIYMKLSLIVPCFNEEENIKNFFDETEKIFHQKGFGYEFVFVDDGSSDNTLLNLKQLYSAESADIQILSFSRNFGKEAAIYAGLQCANGDWVCIIDADLQQRPEVVLQMLEVIDADSSIDCVAAYQENRNESKFIASVKSAFYKIINITSDIDFVNGASDFRLMNKKVVNAILSIGEYHRFSKGIFSFVGFNTKYIPYTAEPRKNGESKWGFKKLLKYAFEGIISFTTLPLKLSTYVGFLSSAASVLYLITVVIQKLFFKINVPGWATIVVLALFLGGIELFSLGIIGEYISRIYLQVKNRPIFILKEHLQSDKNQGR